MPDLNVWLALSVPEHAHHCYAQDWLDDIIGADIAFCRVTEMGLLRLLTNPTILGADVFSTEGAWDLLDKWYAQPNVNFVDEPLTLMQEWRTASKGPRKGPNFWTDAYLAAFARAGGYQFVTFDRALARYDARYVQVLSTSQR